MTTGKLLNSSSKLTTSDGRTDQQRQLETFELWLWRMGSVRYLSQKICSLRMLLLTILCGYCYHWQDGWINSNGFVCYQSQISKSLRNQRNPNLKLWYSESSSQAQSQDMELSWPSLAQFGVPKLKIFGQQLGVQINLSLKYHGSLVNWAGFIVFSLYLHPKTSSGLK